MTPLRSLGYPLLLALTLGCSSSDEAGSSGTPIDPGVDGGDSGGSTGSSGGATGNGGSTGSSGGAAGNGGSTGSSGGSTGSSGGSTGSSGGSTGTGGTAGSGGAGPVVRPHAVGDEIHVNAFEPGDQQEARVAAAADGSFVVVWMSEGQAEAGYSELWGQRFSAAGERLGSEFQISATQASTTFYSREIFDVAMAGDGRFVVAWSGYGSADRRLYAQRYDAAGAAAGARITVDSTTDQWTEYKTSVAMADDGSFGVLYDWEAGFTTGLKVNTYDAAGAPRSTGTWVTDVRRAYEIDLAVGGSGAAADSYVAVYRYFDLDTEVYARQFTGAGTMLASEFHVNTTAQGAQSAPAVDVAPDGTFVVVWQSDHDGQPTSYGVFGQRYAENGSAVGGEFALSAATSGSLGSPAVVTGETGGFLAVWSGRNADTDFDEVFGRYFDATGAPAGDDFQINTFIENNQRDSHVAGSASGRAVAVWTDYRQEVEAAGGDSTLAWGVYGQRLEP